MNARQLIRTTWRRRSWLFGKLSPRKILNLLEATRDFTLNRETTSALPAVVKIDISPICNLSCTMCIHADPNGSEFLDRQVFAPGHRMTIPRYTEIIQQIRHRTASVSLYTWGDPLTHPDLAEMCRIASDAGLQVHISTNYSFKLGDDRIRSLVASGLSHLTVCVDGLSQENYEKTRVGGRIDWVLANLERSCRFRKELGRSTPLVEVQYIKYRHNVHEEEPARRLCSEFGVDEFCSFWGALHNLSDIMPENVPTLRPKPNRLLPGCYWPHFSTVIKYNGDVIPCCEHRGASQHAQGLDARVLGNVFESGLETVWNGEAYRMARRLVSNPERSRTEPKLRQSFCDGCFVIFDTQIAESRRWANEHDYEAIYELDERGRPRRRPKNATGLPD
jgi:MoaA/NifB/PqqE/SkfB family radical SAM enzyme